jgi:hypothetical protein
VVAIMPVEVVAGEGWGGVGVKYGIICLTANRAYVVPYNAHTRYILNKKKSYIPDV